MSASDEGRRRLAADYLTGRTLEEALAAWRGAYDAPTYRERRPMLARVGAEIRRLAAEAERRADTSVDHPGARRRARGDGIPD